MECIKDRYVDNLNKEVLVLKDENLNLRMKLEDMERRLNMDRSIERSLDHENHLLKHDLSKFELINRSMKIEKDHVIMDTELEMIKLQKRLKQLEIDYENLQTEKFNLSDKVTELQQSSTLVDIDLQDSQDIITRVQEDKLRLSQRIEKLTSNQRALVLECERLKRHEKGSKTRDSVNQVEQYMREIEAEKDYWKNEAQLLRELQKKVSRPTVQNQSSPNQQAPVKSQKRGHSKDKRVKELEKEKDELKIQLEAMRKEKSASPQRNRSPSPSMRARSPTKETQKSSDDIVLLKRERDDLRNLLNKLERKVGEIQSNVKMLTQEKDRYCQLYEEAQKEVRNMRQDLVATQEDGGRATSQVKKILSRVELEKDALQKEVGRIQNDRDGLLERYKNEKEGSSQLKQQIEKMEMHLESSERQAANLSSQLAKSEDRNFILEQKLVSLTDELRLQRDDFAHLRCNAGRLDDDKTQLKMTLNEASHRLKHLEGELDRAETELQETRSNLAMTEQQLGKVSEALVSRENENRQIRKKTDNAVGQVDEFQRKLSVLDRDNERLVDNIAELQRSNKSLKKDLNATNEEREDLLAQIQNYVSEVKRIEDLLAERERDQNLLLKQYQVLSEDADVFREKFEMCHRDLLVSKDDVSEREHDLERLQGRLNELERDNSDWKMRNRDLEAKISHLSLLIGQNRDQTCVIQHERDTLMADLSALRDLCGRLEKSKEEVEKELDSRNLDIEQLQANMDDVEHENDVMKEEMRNDRENIRNMESMLNASRGQEQNCVAEIQEKNSELCRFNDNLQMAEEKIEQFEREVQRLKNRNTELEQETERLQRSLTSERFEKDRAQSELRIQSLTSTYKPSCYLASGSHRSCSPCRACSPGYN